MSAEESPFKKFKGVVRKPLSLTEESLVHERYLAPEQMLPLVMEPKLDGVNPAAWATQARATIEQQLHKHGAILFRGFKLDSAHAFEGFVRAVSENLLPYGERSSPRTEISAGVFTSTEHPADQDIHFHNEQSYTRSWPMRLWFFCMTPPGKGGATPIADGRKVLDLLAPEVRQRFIDKKVRYVRNYGYGMGLSWQTAFQTTRREDVESYCRKASIDFEWNGDKLRTSQLYEAIVSHPKTNEPVWFEHTAFFHISSVEPVLRQTLLAEFDEQHLPFNTYYGDGSPIEDTVLDSIRAAYKQVGTRFDWQKGDLLLIDNMLVSHSREAYEGEREILVAMTDLYSPH
ncbi:MAG TPA: TauD/TfdA family dioxygenase [Pyrinomonadaceae bacterium]